MADMTVTAANVALVSGSTERVTAGATITAGQVVYKDTTDANKYKLAINTSVAAAAAGGIALNGASDDQPLVVQTGGTIAPGGTVTVGEIYVVSGSAGRIAVEADNGSGEYVTVLGVGVSSSRIDLSINASGVAVP